MDNYESKTYRIAFPRINGTQLNEYTLLIQ